MKWYGNINNRIDENKQFCKTIEVGTGVTEYLWSDTHAYEVTKVIDQKHVFIRKYDVKHIGEEYTNNWELISNPDNPEIELVKRGNYWYRVAIATLADVEKDDIDTRLWLAHNDFDIAKIREKGMQKKYHRLNVSFGIAQYYYDYEF